STRRPSASTRSRIARTPTPEHCFGPCAKLKAATKKRLETMTTKDHLARHDSQVARLEQVMTALAEAQVKTEEAQAKTDRELAKLARAMTALAESQVELSRQWQAYLNTPPKN